MDRTKALEEAARALAATIADTVADAIARALQKGSLRPDEVGAFMAIIGRELRAEYGPAPGPNAASEAAIRHIKEVAAAEGRPTVEDAWRSHELLVELAIAGEAEA